MVRPTRLVGEFTEYDVDHFTAGVPSSVDPVRGYRIGPQSPCVYGPDGVVQHPPSSYRLPDATAGDLYNLAGPFEHTIGTASSRIWHAQRSSQVVQWDVNVPGFGYVGMLRRNGDYGACFGLAEFWIEDFSGPNEFRHNPTAGGGNWSVPLRLMPSPAVHQSRSVSSTTGTYRDVVVPLEYDPAGGQGPANLHQLVADQSRAVAWWRARQAVQLEVHFGARPNVHRVTLWSFFPRELDQNDAFGGQLVNFYTAALYLQDRFSSSLAYYDPKRRMLTDKSAEWAASDTRQYEATRLGLRSLDGGVFQYDDVSPFTDDCGAVLARDSTTGLVVAMVSNLHMGYGGGLVVPFFASQGERRGAHACSIEAAQRRNPAHPAPGLDVNSGQVFNLISFSREGRDSGWLGMSYLLLTFPTMTETIAAIDALHASKAYLEKPFWIPPSVLAGLPVDLPKR